MVMLLTLIVLQCQKSIYPFHDGAYADFEPIFQKLIEVCHSLIPVRER